MLIGIRLYRTMPEANNNTSAIAYVTSSAERSREGGGRGTQDDICLIYAQSSGR